MSDEARCPKHPDASLIYDETVDEERCSICGCPPLPPKEIQMPGEQEERIERFTSADFMGRKRMAGEYVRYGDHRARVQELEGERNAANAAFRELQRTAEGMLHYEQEAKESNQRRIERDDALSHLARLEEALKELIEEAASMDRQIDGEWGVPGAPYEEDEAITKARAALTHSTPPSVDTREDNPNDWPDP